MAAMTDANGEHEQGIGCINDQADGSLARSAADLPPDT